MIKIFTDADNCTRKVRAFLENFCQSNKNTKLFFVANHQVLSDKDTPLFEMIICPQEKDSADNYIFENCDCDSIIITRDLGLASRLLDKQKKIQEELIQKRIINVKPKLPVMNDKGILFDSYNLPKMLKDRELSLNLQAIGINRGKIGNNYSQKDYETFCRRFSEIASLMD